MRFHVTVDRQEDGLWIVECPAIPGCVSQGQTKDEALDNIKEAIALCLEVRAKEGVPLSIETLQIEVTVREDIENLKQKAEQLFQQGKWDECIPVLTEHISLEADSQLKSEAFGRRGVAYNNKGDYDLAIADCNEAIQLNRNNAGAFYVRGVAYYNKGNYDRAIANFNEAIRLNLDDADDIFSYRGAAYCKKGDYDRAIADCNEAIRLNRNDARAFNNRGFSYYNKGDYGRAIKDFKRAIQLKPDRRDAFNNRGAAYAKKGDYNRAFKDFLSADEKNKELKSAYTGIYIATQIADIYADRSKKDTGRTLKLYLSLFEAISNIREKLFYAPQRNTEVAHYTSLPTLKSLADKGLFRLYSAAYMNDPEEGRAFFEIMKDHEIENVEEVFYGNNEKKPQLSPAYIGSFVKVNAIEPGQKDELFLWRTYGKHDGQEAAGACLIFKNEETNFASSSPLRISAMAEMQGQLFSIRQPIKPTLYRIAYRSDCIEEKELSNALKKLATSLKAINTFCEKLENAEQKKRLAKLVRELLDDIRFLFKANHYREEREVRVVQVRSYKENMMQEQDGIQVDTGQIPPRFYLETHKNFCFSEVILGPKARGAQEWQRWLKEQGHNKVEPSEIKYGTKCP